MAWWKITGGMKRCPSSQVNTIKVHHNGVRSPFFTFHIFSLENTFKYTQPCAIYYWVPTQLYHSSTLADLTTVVVFDNEKPYEQIFGNYTWSLNIFSSSEISDSNDFFMAYLLKPTPNILSQVWKISWIYHIVSWFSHRIENNFWFKKLIDTWILFLIMIVSVYVLCSLHHQFKSL